LLLGELRFDDPSADDVRRTMREIFERPEFQRSKSLLQRVVDQILEWLGRNTDVQAPGVSPSGWGGPIGTIVLWVAAILVVIALALLVRKIILAWRPRRKTTSKPVDVHVDDERDATEWASDAEALEAAGRWKDAIRCRYRELVARLVESETVSPMAGRTTGELRADLASGAPVVAREFSEATLLFELPWYADAPTGPPENHRFRELSAAVLAGAADSRRRRGDAGDAPGPADPRPLTGATR
jgi:Domain of unknown function (DUF4129)